MRSSRKGEMLRVFRRTFLVCGCVVSRDRNSEVAAVVVRTSVATKMSAALATMLRPRSLYDVRSAVRKRVMRRERSMHGSTSHADGWGCAMVERRVRCWCAATRHLNRELACEKVHKLQGHCVSFAGW